MSGIEELIAAFGEAGAGAAAGGGGAAAGAGAAAGGISTSTVLGSLATAAVGAGLSAALAPKMPGGKPVTSMPDQQAVMQNARRALIEQTARRGRAGTILSDPSGDTLG